MYITRNSLICCYLMPGRWGGEILIEDTSKAWLKMRAHCNKRNSILKSIHAVKQRRRDYSSDATKEGNYERVRCPKFNYPLQLFSILFSLSVLRRCEARSSSGEMIQSVRKNEGCTILHTALCDCRIFPICRCRAEVYYLR